MILDTSAVVAVITEEPEADAFRQKMVSAKELAMGAPTLLETAMVLSSRFDEDAPVKAQRFLQVLNAIIIPFEEAHYHEAVRAFLRYGKGRHPAKLNFGDCLSYATASVAHKPLLCKGDDFAKTDLTLA